MSSNSSHSSKKNDPFAPWDQDQHARDLEKVDVFNRLCDDCHPVPGGFRSELEKLANSDNKEVIAALAEHNISSPRVPQRFYLSNGQEAVVWADDSGFHSAAIFNGEQINFSAATRDEVLMLPERYLQQKSGPHFNELTDDQRLNIVRLAQNGDWQTALGSYLYFVLGDEVTTQHPEQIASNPKWLPAMNSGVYFVWRHMNNSYFASAETEAALSQFAGDRPLTIALCNAWWLAYQDDIGQRRADQADAPETDPLVTQDDLERLSDRDLAKLRTAALQMRARRVREVLGR